MNPEYTEGDQDSSITGLPILWKDTSNTLRVPSATKAMPVDVLSGGGTDPVGLKNVAGATINPAKEDGNLSSIKTNTDNLTSDPATATKQLADNHNVTVSNPTADTETGLATSAKQDSIIAELEALSASVTTALTLTTINTAYKMPASELAGRRLLVIYNVSDTSVYIGSSAVTTTTGILLAAGGVMNIDNEKDLYAICGTAGKIINLLEVA